MNAVKIAREENITFLLAVGGGSVLDGTKFIAATRDAYPGNPWQRREKRYPNGLGPDPASYRL
jgi:NADP-dependent alcohol dehydrogenase